MRLNVGRRFGTHVRTLRHARELTQEELAERSTLSVDAVRRIERGAFSPSLDTVNKLAVGLDVSLRTLFQDFDRDRRDQVAELCDYLGKRSRNELRMVWRVMRAMFEESARAPGPGPRGRGQ